MKKIIMMAAAILLVCGVKGVSGMEIPSGRKVMVIGHRGASGYAPENTMTSFKMAKEMGADMIEYDVYMSADGVPVIMHDDKVDRTTDGTGSIEEMTLEQIKKLDAGSKTDKKYAGEKVPTLEEVVSWAAENKILMNIEIKGAGCEEKIVELLKKYKMTDKTIVSSFNHEFIKKIRKLEPKIEIAALIGDVENIDAIVKNCHPDDLNPRFMKLTKGQVADAHAAGLRVNVYTVNDAVFMRQMIGFGVDGIFTNNPDVLIKILDKKKTQS